MNSLRRNRLSHRLKTVTLRFLDDGIVRSSIFHNFAPSFLHLLDHFKPHGGAQV